ncbi:MAG: hypothetical protein ACRDVN_06535 [Jiangellaceae bacterium]
MRRVRCAVPHASCSVLNLLRYVLWVMTTGLIAAGSGRCGGYDVYVAWKKAGPPAPRCRYRTDAAVARDAARGIAEIEAFLTAQCAVGDRTRDPSRRGTGRPRRRRKEA